jgi:hypothetical protein
MEDLKDKDPPSQAQNGNQNGECETKDIAKERRHMNFGGFGDRFDH